MRRFRLRLLTPQGVAFDEEILSLVFRTEDGEIGILGGREHAIFDLEEGILRIKNAEEKTLSFFVGAGVAEVTEQVVSILTGEAYPEESVQEGRKMREDALAKEKKRQEQSAIDYQLTKVSLSRAFEKLKRKHKE